MKISGTISFVIMLLLGLLNLFLGLGMEAVLKSSIAILISSGLIILLSIVIFVAGLKENSIFMRWTGFITIIISIGLGLALMTSIRSDIQNHQQLLDTHNSSTLINFISCVTAFILGIVNTIIAFTKKQNGTIKESL